MLVTLNLPTSVKGKAAGIPRVDIPDADTNAMRLMFDDILYFTLPPHMEPLCFAFPFGLAGDIEMLHHNNIGTHISSVVYNRRPDLLCVVFIDSGCFPHVTVPASEAVLPLPPACAAELRVHPVFFTREVDELPGEDSSIGTHNAAHGIRIDNVIIPLGYLVVKIQDEINYEL